MKTQEHGLNLRIIALVVTLGFSLNLVWGKVAKEFPAHWGKPPEIQTQDYVELPADYGHGSSTLAKWIATNLKRDQAGKTEPAQPAALYENNFEKAEAGKLPDEFMALAGDFLVKRDGTNQCLDLPGSPLDSYAVQFGPTESVDVVAGARVFGTAKGRRAPTFGVGLGGVAGFKLQVAPAKKALELLKDQEVKTSVAFEWQTGAWTQLRLQIRKAKTGAWKIEGKAWSQGSAEPKEWMVSFDETEAPVGGRASVLGSPFAGTPILFDDLRVERVAEK
ncbi:MAG: hypothetical protein V9H26_24440 [Verrucomicrobiota bacterium]|nr:hypothetical protein [Limisphaerales bacterium]